MDMTNTEHVVTFSTEVREGGTTYTYWACDTCGDRIEEGVTDAAFAAEDAKAHQARTAAGSAR